MNDDDQWEVTTFTNTTRRRRIRPCAECPWRKDVPTHRFPPHVFHDSANVGRQPSTEEINAWAEAHNSDGPDHPIQSMFACHMSGSGERGATCAGFLASESSKENLAVRLAVTFDHIPPEALTPQPGWPPLYATHEDMARANGALPEEQDENDHNDRTHP